MSYRPTIAYLPTGGVALGIDTLVAGVSLAFDVMLYAGRTRITFFTVGPLGLRGGIECHTRDSQCQDACQKYLFAFPKISC
jgi:hypothetical protein